MYSQPVPGNPVSTLNRDILRNPVPLPHAPSSPIHGALFHMLGLHAEEKITEKTVLDYEPIPAVKITHARIALPAKNMQTKPTTIALPAPAKTTPVQLPTKKISVPTPTTVERVPIEPFLARMNAGSLRFPALQRRVANVRHGQPKFAPAQPTTKIHYSFRDAQAPTTIRTGQVHRFVAPRERQNPDIRTAMTLLDMGLHAHQLPMRMGTKKAAHAIRTIRAAANRKEWHAARHAK